MKIESIIGRPTTYTADLAAEICAAISSTSMGLKALCNTHPHWPCRDTIYTWLLKYPEFADMYAQAKRNQVEILVDEILQLADDGVNDDIIDENGNVTCNADWINRVRLQIDTRKWIACKLVPKVYGDKVSNAHTIDVNSESVRQTLEDIRNIRLEYKMEK